ncbi:MAG TPA: D-hexose-6-phosphate mutarotase [Myxococcota bacterium]
MATQTFEDLKRDFTIEGNDSATWEKTPGGLSMLFIRTEQCEARVFAHGGHVAAWTPAGQRPGLHLSPKSAFDPKKAIRGGIPICFPWFGNRSGGHPARDAELKSPAHGFVRTRAWHVDEVSLEENGRMRVVMSMHDDDETRALWDAAFQATVTATLGQTLQVSLAVKNTGTSDLEIEEALHTYLEVGDVNLVKIVGLEATQYIDKVDDFKEKTSGTTPLMLSGETDSIYLATKGTVTVDDPLLKRHIRVEKTGSTSTVVWNPWMVKATAMPDVGGDAWKSFVCVEAANVKPGHNISIPQGAVHTVSTRLTILPQTREA